MSGVYIVTDIDTSGTIHFLEGYAGFALALEKAIAQAHLYVAPNSIWMQSNPEEIKLLDGSSKWIVLDNSHNVEIKFLSIKNTISDKKLEENPDWQKVQKALFPTEIKPNIISMTERWTYDMPAGWGYDKKPIRIEDIHNDPYCFNWNFSTENKKALIKAIISKTDNYFATTSFGVFNKEAALQALKEDGIAAQEIIVYEFSVLINYIADLQDKPSDSE